MSAIERITLYPDELVTIYRALHNERMGITPAPPTTVPCSNWDELSTQIQHHAAYVQLHRPRRCGIVVKWTDGIELNLTFQLTAQHTSAAVASAEIQSFQAAAASIRAYADREKGPVS